VQHHRATAIFPSDCQLGEGSLWDTAQQRLYWVDIIAHKVFAFDPRNGSNLAFDVGESVGTVVLTKNDKLLLALRRGFAWLDPATGRLTHLVDPESDNPATRFNDGKCDPRGRFWAGTIREREGELGGLYCLDEKLQVTKKLGGIRCSNGLVWTRDASRFYYTDTPTHEVWAFDYDAETATIADRRVALRIPGEVGAPDGMTIDAEDRLWIALWGGGKVLCYDPRNDTFVAEVEVPAKNVTSCAFGGPDLTDLYITTARVGVSPEELIRQPLTGSLFRVALPCRGVASVRFASAL
jgi:sugar lactone lactonase YvrE